LNITQDSITKFFSKFKYHYKLEAYPGKRKWKTDTIKFGVNFKAQRETQYAMNLGGSDDLKVGFDISKNINGFDIDFNAN